MLLIGGCRSLVDAVHVELAARGYEDVRPVHDFAIRATASTRPRRVSLACKNVLNNHIEVLPTERYTLFYN